MERLKFFALVLLLSGQAWGLPNPDAEAQAEAEALPAAEADADPDADPQMMGGYPFSAGMYSYPSAPVSSPIGYPIGGGGGLSDSCGMSQQCCNFADQNCCMDSQPKCYTQYVQDCKWQDRPRCEQRFDTKCIDYDAIGCRVKAEIRKFKVPNIKCTPRLAERCFTYERRYCNYTQTLHEEPIEYIEQTVRQTPDQTQQCFEVPSCRYTNVSIPITTQEPQQVCENITIPINQCSLVPQEGPSQRVPQTIYTTQTRRVCYDKPVYKCKESECGQPCQGSTTPCSQGTSPQTICPVAGLPDECGYPDYCNSCQQVDVPNCGLPNNCQQQQRCCYWTTEKVWVDQVIRVPQTTWVTIPGKVTYVRKCTQVPTVRPNCRIVPRPVTKYVTQQKCITEKKQECIELEKPNFDVENLPQNTTAKAYFQVCNIQMRTEKFCKKVEVDVDCVDVPRYDQISLKYHVCDVRSRRKSCGKVPYSYCAKGTGTNVCTTIPKTVCPQTCNPSPQCNTCSDYYNSGSAQPCGTGQCNAYYSPYLQSPGSAGYMPLNQAATEPTIMQG